MVDRGTVGASGQESERLIQSIVDGQHKLLKQRFSVFIWVALASTVGYVIYSHALDSAPSVFVTWSTFAGFCAASLALYRFKNYKLASHLYLWSAAWAICTASLYTGQAFSESLWLLPIVPVTGAYLLGTRTAIVSSVLSAFCLLAVHVSAVFVEIPETVPDENLGFLSLRLMALGMFTVFGVWTTRTSDAQLNALKAKAQELMVERERAEVANEAKSLFLANMSHEIRTPLNGMLGMTRHLHQNAKNPEEKDNLETILVSQESLLTLLNDILDFSKIEAGGFALECADFDLDAAICEVARLFATQATNKGVKIEPVNSGGPSLVQGDSKRVRQVLCNLVGNAVKFSDKGTITIEWATQIESSLGDEQRGSIRIQVKDEGIGIPRRMQTRLFRKFEQVHDTTTLDVGGTGLGLAICKGLIEAMGGELSVQSTVGRGSVFSFEIPTKFQPKQALRSDKSFAVPPRCSKPQAQRQEPTRILLVDDNAINRKVATLGLNQLGCQVTEAVDGQEALERCKLHRFELIFMDLRMPRLNGADATRAIRRDPNGCNRETPIIALTANAYQEDRVRCEAAGMQEHLSKPFRNEDLEAILRKYVWSPTLDKDQAA